MSCEWRRESVSVNRRVGVNVANVASQMTYLVAESVEELDGVDEEEHADRTLSALEVGVDVLREELDDVDEDVGRGDTVLGGRAARGDRGEEVDGCVLGLPVLGWVGGVLLAEGGKLSAPIPVTNAGEANEQTHSEVGGDVLLDNGSDVALELLHQGTRKVGSGLTASVALCVRWTRTVSLSPARARSRGERASINLSKAQGRFGCTRWGHPRTSPPRELWERTALGRKDGTGMQTAGLTTSLTPQAHVGEDNHLEEPLERSRLLKERLVLGKLDDDAEEPERAADEDVLARRLGPRDRAAEELPDGLNEGREKVRAEGVRVAESEELEDRADLGADLGEGRGRCVVVLMDMPWTRSVGGGGGQGEGDDDGTYVATKLFSVPAEVLAKKPWVAHLGVAEEDGQVVLEELREVLGIEVIEDLEKKEKRLGEILKGSGRRKLRGGQRKELVGPLMGGRRKVRRVVSRGRKKAHTRMRAHARRKAAAP